MYELPLGIKDDRLAAGAEAGIDRQHPLLAERAGEQKLAEILGEYFDGGQVEVAAHLVYELDPDGKQLRVVRFTEYAAEKVRTLYPSAADLRSQWADPQRRSEIIDRLAERGIDFDELAAATQQPDADPFDLLCHVAFNAPLRTRRERADRLRREKKDLTYLRGCRGSTVRCL